MTPTSEYEQQAQAFSQSYQLAQTGDAEAQYQTGFYYAQGIGVAQNYRSAGFYGSMLPSSHTLLRKLIWGYCLNKAWATSRI